MSHSKIMISKILVNIYGGKQYELCYYPVINSNGWMWTGGPMRIIEGSGYKRDEKCVIIVSSFSCSSSTVWPSSFQRTSLSAPHMEASSLTGMKRPTTCSPSPACSCFRWSSWSPATPGSSVRSPDDWKQTTVSSNPSLKFCGSAF